VNALEESESFRSVSQLGETNMGVNVGKSVAVCSAEPKNRSLFYWQLEENFPQLEDKIKDKEFIPGGFMSITFAQSKSSLLSQANISVTATTSSCLVLNNTGFEA